MVVLLATGSYDGSIRFWDATDATCYLTLDHKDSKTSSSSGGEKQVNCLQISPDKQFIVAGGNSSIKLYDINSQGSEPLVTYDGHTSNVTAVGFQKDGRWMFSSSEDGTIKIWDPRATTAQCDHASPHAVNAVVLHPNQGELISGDHGGNVRIWDLTAGKYSYEVSPEGDTPVSSVAVAPNASLVAACNFNGSLFTWTPSPTDISKGMHMPEETQHRVQAHRAYITSCKISANLRTIATTSSDKTIRLWNTDDFSLANTLQHHSKWVWDCAFSADSSYLATASSDTTALLWETESAKVVRMYRGHSKAITAVVLNDSEPYISS